jgi:rhodanese-related sulfurtransferase
LPSERQATSGAGYAMLIKMITIIHRDEIYSKFHGFIDSTFGAPAPERFILVEVGFSNAYDQVHIKNAVHMTLEEVENQARSRLPDLGTQIIIYGQNRKSSEPREALRVLDRLGYFNLFYYAGGKEDWIKAGLEVQYGLVPADHFGAQIPEKG